MALEENPYASPLAEDTSRNQDAEESLVVDGKVLIVPKGAQFPDRCIKCNAPADGYKLKRVLAWHPSWIYILLFLAMFFYIILAMVMRKESTLKVGLCETHRRKRQRLSLIGYSLTTIGVFATAAAFPLESIWLGVVGGLGAFISLLVTLVCTQVISADRITDTHTRVKGCGPEFLLSLS